MYKEEKSHLILGLSTLDFSKKKIYITMLPNLLIHMLHAKQGQTSSMLHIFQLHD